jgi:hypothetical protein
MLQREQQDIKEKMDMQGDSKLLSGFPFICHGNPDNNFESSWILAVEKFLEGQEGRESYKTDFCGRVWRLCTFVRYQPYVFRRRQLIFSLGWWNLHNVTKESKVSIRSNAFCCRMCHRFPTVHQTRQCVGRWWRSLRLNGRCGVSE